MFLLRFLFWGCTTIIEESIYRLVIEKKEINELFSFSQKDEIMLRFYSNKNFNQYIFQCKLRKLKINVFVTA